MQIRKWHIGKIVLLWAWGIASTAFLLRLLERARQTAAESLPGQAPLESGTLLTIVIIAIPLGLSVITWKWLGGKEEVVKEEQTPAAGQAVVRDPHSGKGAGAGEGRP